MPCQSDYMRDPGPSDSQRTQAELDRLTAENDWLRELILRLLAGESVTKQELQRVNRDQIKHRKEDLARLEKVFRELVTNGATAPDLYERLGRVVTADPRKPLAPQLGFDPDSI